MRSVVQLTQQADPDIRGTKTAIKHIKHFSNAGIAKCWECVKYFDSSGGGSSGSW